MLPVVDWANKAAALENTKTRPKRKCFLDVICDLLFNALASCDYWRTIERKGSRMTPVILIDEFKEGAGDKCSKILKLRIYRTSKARLVKRRLKREAG